MEYRIFNGKVALSFVMQRIKTLNFHAPYMTENLRRFYNFGRRTTQPCVETSLERNCDLVLANHSKNTYRTYYNTNLPGFDGAPDYVR